jgi:hypothetical protein
MIELSLVDQKGPNSCITAYSSTTFQILSLAQNRGSEESYGRAPYDPAFACCLIR